MNNTQLLPPKMAQQYAELAKKGQADNILGNIFEFFRGNQKITLMNLDPPFGHVQKLTTSRMESEKLRAKK